MKNYKSGIYIKEGANTLHQYEFFIPAKINKNFTMEDQKIFIYLEKATKLLGELNAYAKLIPDVDFFIQMHVRAEAVSSSKIEGTKTEINEVLLPEGDIDPEKRNDWLEVQNYIKSMNNAISSLGELPVSVRLIKKAHQDLLSDVRGEHKLPGEIRRSQNWVGGSSINTAYFVPPHYKEVPELLSDWESFWHNYSIDVPVLLKIAIGHYQFETIHPFLDGNGRIGRLLISLQLIERDFISKPVLYISSYFENHRQAYYDALDNVRSKNDLEGWILFFLEGVIQTAENSKKTFEDIILLRKTFEEKASTLGRKVVRARKLLLFLFSQPIVGVHRVAEYLEIKYNSANNLIKDFESLDILEEKTGYSRNRLFIMKDYIQLFRK